LYVPDALADWEIAFLITEINSGRYLKKDIQPSRIIKAGNDLSSITTMGGIKITPDVDVDKMNVKNGDFIVLPGANTWQNGNNQKILDKVSDIINKDITVAAICGATFALADNGIFGQQKTYQ
jgi:putative intracellular protease/amidase